jgi:serine/threonine protein phosphatase PrpC
MFFCPFSEWAAPLAELGAELSGCVARGPRAYQEDRLSLSVSVRLRMAVALVADGHGGSGVAHCVQHEMCALIVRAMEERGAHASVLRECVRDMDERVRALEGMEECGACVAVACVLEDRVLLASLGDCAAFADGKRLCAPHSVDADRARLARLPPGECAVLARARARGAGGARGARGARLLCGGRSLGFARALGDFFAKRGDDESAFVVSREPDVREVPRPARYLLLCSDGIADGLGDRRLPELVDELFETLPHPSQRRCVPQLLAYHASRASRDNMSCILVDFAPAAPAARAAPARLAALCALRLACEPHASDALCAHALPGARM